jgi:hypothetical protein
MQCAKLSDDELWRAIAKNTEKISALIHKQLELEHMDSAVIHPGTRRDLITFASRFQREYQQYADELRRRYPLG